MTYDPVTHARANRAHLQRLVREGGKGWHDYALDRAATLEREDPSLHAGLQQAVLDAGARRSGAFPTTKGRR